MITRKLALYNTSYENLLKKIATYSRIRLILLIKQLALEILPGKTDYVKFIILCSPRTGSTWLHTLLNSHVNIHSQGEVVRVNHNSKKLPFESIAFRRHPPFIKAVGLKIFYDDPIYKEALNYITSHKEVKILLLVRKSKIEQFVSYKKALKTSQWTHSKNHKSKKINLDIKEFREYINKQTNDYQKVLEKLMNHDIHEITYEELISGKTEVLNKIQDFLGVPKKKLTSLLKKQSIRSVNHQIENWEEVKDHL